MASEIRGVVQSGKGEARGFTQLDWVTRQICDKLGFDPFPGTLNVHAISGDIVGALHRARGVRIEPATGYCVAHCYRVQVNGNVDAVWIVPELPWYAADQIELIAPISLRDTLQVKDGEIVTVRIEGEM